FVGFFETRQLHGAEDQGAVSQANGFLLQCKAESFAGQGGVKTGGQGLNGVAGWGHPKMSCSLLFSHASQVTCGKEMRKREANSRRQWRGSGGASTNNTRAHPAGRDRGRAT